MTTVAAAHPSRHSGLDAIWGFADAFGHQRWLCRPKNEDLLSQLQDIRGIEPDLSGDFLKQCIMRTTWPSKYAKSLLAVAARCARCNCLVVSHSVLDDDLSKRLCLPSVSLVSYARPWLTLLSCSPGEVKYWQRVDGPKTPTRFLLPDDAEGRAFFVARLLVASIPDKIVIRTDACGVALRRAYGSQILGTIREVSLLMDAQALERSDRRWVSEFVARHYSDLSSLVVHWWDHSSLPSAAMSGGTHVLTL